VVSQFIIIIIILKVGQQIWADKLLASPRQAQVASKILNQQAKVIKFRVILLLKINVRSWAFIALVIAAKFIVNQCPLVLEIWAQVNNNTFHFQQHPIATSDLLPPLFPSF
jgi:hypothetical protein